MALESAESLGVTRITWLRRGKRANIEYVPTATSHCGHFEPDRTASICSGYIGPEYFLSFEWFGLDPEGLDLASIAVPKRGSWWKDQSL